MKPGDFESSPSGRLVPTERSQKAFVPHPLPPPLDLGALTNDLARAAKVIGELNGIGRTLPDPYLLIRPLQSREALASSGMEGTYTTADALLLAEAGGHDPSSTDDTLEVLNYRLALSEAIVSLDHLPLCLRTLRDAHRTLLTGVATHRGASIRAGEFKVHQNFIGSYAIETARFIPPPPSEALDCLNSLEKYIHGTDSNRLPDLVEAALIHYQFETIHPFSDGNGRVGRMLIPLFLYHRGTIRQPLLYPSPYLERHKDEYIDRMFEVSRSGDWHGWISFFLRSLEAASMETIDIADAILDIQRDYRSRLQVAGRSANLLRIVDRLFEAPVITIPQIAEFAGVTYRAAQANLRSLQEVGIVGPVEGTSNPKYYAAWDIVRAVGKGRS